MVHDESKIVEFYPTSKALSEDVFNVELTYRIIALLMFTYMIFRFSDGCRWKTVHVAGPSIYSTFISLIEKIAFPIFYSAIYFPQGHMQDTIHSGRLPSRRDEKS